MIEHINALGLVLDVDVKSWLMDILLFRTVIKYYGHYHSKLFNIGVCMCQLILIMNLVHSVRLPEQPTTSGSDGTFIRRRKPITTTDQVAVPENTHHTVKSYKQTLNKLD